VDVFIQAKKRRDNEIVMATKQKLTGMTEPDVLGLIGQYAGMQSLTPEQRKTVIQNCLKE
jgi:hypothetical protein